MTTVRKPRSTTAARKPTVGAETNSLKKTATAKSASKPAKTAARKPAGTQGPVRVAPLHGSASGAVAARETPMATSETNAALQGGAAPAPHAVSPDALRHLIAEAAYYRAERRGFAPGGEETDWLEAEAEVRRRERSAR